MQMGLFGLGDDEIYLKVRISSFPLGFTITQAYDPRRKNYAGKEWTSLICSAYLRG